jgi:hypothetical protein
MKNSWDAPTPVSSDHKALGGPRSQSLDGPDARKYLWVGRVIHVDTETMVCSIRLETGVGSERHDIPLPALGGAGPRSWAGSILEPGSKVLLGWKQWDHRSFKPYIIGAMTVGTYSAREYEPFSTIDPADLDSVRSSDPDLVDDPRNLLEPVRIKSRKAYSGDFLASSSGGSDAILDKDVYFTNAAGNEVRVRSSDQTVIVQTVNEFTNNAVGYYRRGLIKRNAFNFLADLFISGETRPGKVGSQDLQSFLATKTPDDLGRVYVDQVPVNSPAYAKLLAFGLVNSEGFPTFPNNPYSDGLNDPFYPFLTTSDGQRASYIVHGEHDKSFAETNLCYVEDRADLRHTSDGIQTVTEEGDGVQIDSVSPSYIEDVKGTVVGNDPHSEVGRSLYKRILKMEVFNTPEQGSPSVGPRFEPIDTITDQYEADTKALARLFKIQSPTSSNQFVFAVSKEGKVSVHVPKTQTGGPTERGQSVDMNLMGLLKAIIGSDEKTRKSIDLTTSGGISLNIGAFKETPDGPSVSVDMTVAGKIRTNFVDPTGKESFIGGNDFRSVSGTVFDVITGGSVRSVGGTDSTEATAITHNAGAGGLKQKIAGAYDLIVLGKTSMSFAQPRTTTLALSDTKTILAGVDSTTVLAGSITRSVVTGNMSDSVATGNMSASVGAGNYSVSVGTGNLSATIGAGNLSFSVATGSASISSGLTTSILAGVTAIVAAPVVKLGNSVTGCVVVGAPGPGSVHLDYLFGIPILGLPNILAGV